jgi:amphi-Trp domain-containing protein
MSINLNTEYERWFWKKLTKRPTIKLLAFLINFRMIKQIEMENRDVEKGYSKEEFVSKLRRLADSIEKGENFRISVAGEAIYVPDRAIFTIEHERNDGSHELEFQIKWTDQ